MLPDVVDIAVGGAHGLALDRGGGVWSWGLNLDGQLGNGDSGTKSDGTTPKFNPTPGQVLGGGGTCCLSGGRAVAAGGSHSLALKGLDGEVWAWGLNNQGQLGNGESGQNSDGSFKLSSVPVQVVDADDNAFTGVEAIAANSNYSLALKDGVVWAWGFGSRIVDSDTPTAIQDEDGNAFGQVTTLAAGAFHVLALREDHTVWAWGRNDFFQMSGAAGITGSSTPVQVAGANGEGVLENVIAIAAGESHSLALTADGTVWAWGRNDDGRLGIGRIGSDTGFGVVWPTRVVTGDGAPLTDVIAVSAGNSHSLALAADGTVWAWGSNDYGQLGDSSGQPSDHAVQVDTINLDANPPTSSAEPTADPDGYDTAVTVTLEAADTLDPSPTIYYTLDGSDPTDPAGTRQHFDGHGTIELAQTTTLKFYAVDAAYDVVGAAEKPNHVSPVHTQTYIIRPDAVAHLADEESNEVLIGTTVTLDGSDSSDPSGADLTYDWAITDAPTGGTATITDADQATATFTPDVYGEYEFTLTVTTGAGTPGETSATDTVTITAQTEPAAAFTVQNADPDHPDDLFAGTAVRFTDTSTDPDDTDAGGTVDKTGWTWQWNFGDPASGADNEITSDDPTVHHIYDTPGIYHVTMRVTDDDGHTSTPPPRVIAVGGAATAAGPGVRVTNVQSKDTVSGNDRITDFQADFGIVVTKFGEGTPLITVAEYADNPTKIDVFGASNHFFDLNLDSADDVTEVVFTVDLKTGVDPAGLVLKWFNPETGTWEFVKEQELRGDGASGYFIEATLNRTDSSPTVQQLTGTIYGIGPQTVPSVQLLAPRGGVRWNGEHAIRWQATDPDGAEDQMKIQLAYAPADGAGGVWRPIADDEANDGVYTWDTSQVPLSGKYRVRVTATDELDSTATATSDPFFISRAQAVTSGPNPASDRVTFYFGPDVDHGALYVYDASGALVWKHAVVEATFELHWDLTDRDGRPLANGLYLYRFVGDDGTRTEIGKLVVIR